MKSAEIVEKPIKVKVILRRVKPETVEKLQADVAILKRDVSDKQKVIDKLQTDLESQETRIGNLEGVSP